MAYRLSRTDRTVADAIRRIAVERIDDAVAAIDDPDVSRDKAVHTVRKRCKDLRALVRLTEPVLAGAGKEDRAFRDLARGLSGFRDAAVRANTFESLVSGRTDTLDPATVAAVRAYLATDTAPTDNADKGRAEREDALAVARDRLAAARLNALSWKIGAKGWRAFGEGLEETYRKARRRMARALADEKPRSFHEWRKDAKYHGHHLKVLRPLWPAVMKPAARAADDLAETLGNHHDLEVLAATLKKEADALGGKAAVEPLIALCKARQDAHARLARSAGARLFAEKPKAFSHRMHAYWSAWRREQRDENDARTAAPSMAE